MNHKEKLEQKLIKICSKVDFDYTDFKKTLIECKKNKTNLDAKSVDLSGRTALHRLCEKNRNKAIKDIIKAGANIEAKDQIGRTPLFYSCDNESIKDVKTLLENGANIEQKNKSEKTPLDIAIENNQEKIIDILKQEQAKRIDEQKNGKRLDLPEKKHKQTKNIVKEILSKQNKR